MLVDIKQKVQDKYRSVGRGGTSSLVRHWVEEKSVCTQGHMSEGQRVQIRSGSDDFVTSILVTVGPQLFERAEPDRSHRECSDQCCPYGVCSLVSLLPHSS